MRTVTSKDGTTIGYERDGSGSPIIFATGAFNDHTTCAGLAAALSDRYRVVTYDRRARGASADTRPYAIEREIEDLAAVIDVVGGSAAVFGFSSGAVLGLKAAADGVAVTDLVLYEPPICMGGDPASDLPQRMQALVDAGRPGDAVVLFQTQLIGLPAEMVAQIRQAPMFTALEAMAQSAVYDATITTVLSEPTPAMCAVKVPVLVLTGADTWPNLVDGAKNLTSAIPGAIHQEVTGGANHEIPTAATAARLRDFLRPLAY
jgi:pimeloyl-ACP methyl ester carboxylesterase